MPIPLPISLAVLGTRAPTSIAHSDLVVFCRDLVVFWLLSTILPSSFIALCCRGTVLARLLAVCSACSARVQQPLVSVACIQGADVANAVPPAHVEGGALASGQAWQLCLAAFVARAITHPSEAWQQLQHPANHSTTTGAIHK